MLRWIILSLFLIETVILAPNSNFVVLPATDACADCDNQCADCSFLNNSSSSTTAISDQSLPTPNEIRKTNYENTDSEILPRVRRCVGEGCEFSNAIERLKNHLKESLCLEDNEKLNVKITQLENDVKKSEGKIKNLELQLRQKNNEIGKLNSKLQTVQNEKSKIESVNEDLNGVVANLNTLQSSADSEIKKLQNNVTDLNNKVLICDRETNKIDESIEEIQGNLKLAVNDKVKLENDIKSSNDGIDKLKVSIVDLDQELESNKRLRDTLQESNEKHTFKIVECEEAIKVLKNNQNNTGLEADLKNYEALISVEQNSIKENEQKIHKIETRNDQLVKEKDDLQSNIDMESQKVKNLENNLEEIKSEMNNSQLKIELLVKNKEDLVDQIVATEINLANVLKINQDFDKENIDLRNQKRQHKSEMDFLETQLTKCNKGKD